MMGWITPRLRVPAIWAAGGTIFAAAWAIRGGPLWWLSVFTEATVLARVLGVYLWGREDTDEGALAASRGDERQQEIAQRAWALAGKVTMAAALIGASVTIALRSPAAWPVAFGIMFATSTLSFLFGLSANGSASTSDDENSGYVAQYPVNH
ncbi:MAG TPA: hypothetical protein VEL03_18045 [Streptosporangiaceae bacterium]|nr:hypothetical protein [Streptosporangiaceae bacterium]